jgi:hypothetical protein
MFSRAKYLMACLLSLLLAGCGSAGTGGQTINNLTRLDSDGDGLFDADEQICGSNLLMTDSDADGLGDYAECKTYNSDPNLPDTDGDGLTDAEEANLYGSNPTVMDTDLDGVEDKAEVDQKTSPLNTDSDCDGTNDKDDSEPAKKVGATFQMNSGDPNSTAEWLARSGDPGELASSPDAGIGSFETAALCTPSSFSGRWRANCGTLGYTYVRGRAKLPVGTETGAQLTQVSIYMRTDDYNSALDFNGFRFKNYSTDTYGQPTTFLPGTFTYSTNLGQPIDGYVAVGGYGRNTQDNGTMLLVATITYNHYYSVDECPAAAP